MGEVPPRAQNEHVLHMQKRQRLPALLALQNAPHVSKLKSPNTPLLHARLAPPLGDAVALEGGTAVADEESAADFMPALERLFLRVVFGTPPELPELALSVGSRCRAARAAAESSAAALVVATLPAPLALQNPHSRHLQYRQWWAFFSSLQKLPHASCVKSPGIADLHAVLASAPDA